MDRSAPMKILVSSWLAALLLTCGVPTSAATAEVTLIRHPERVTELDSRNDYFLALLRLALEKTIESDGPYVLSAGAATLTQGRAISLLADGEELDILWSMTSRQREAQLRPIRIPLLKGLMGFRVFVIRREDQPWFRSMDSLDELRELSVGQGHDWPDADILRANGFRVETSSDYNALFFMLEAGRVDFLPRALNEPWEEVRVRPEMNLKVEDSLLLYYPTASYFFVNPANVPLAERIERGLRRAMEDGSFEELFLNFPVNRHALEQVNLSARRVLKLTNPLLPAETPLDDPSLWWKPL